ncbi:MAG: (2Fe-2S)-binding protein [Thermoplasmata archaeon]|nr:MAG: (2Fe-2S)-binding protein [Thermoplasmata archaeon]
MKTIVCRCHDVTEEDLEAAIDAGYDDLETLKRISGVTTGHCQGKFCMLHSLDILARKKGKKISELTRIRPPLDPIPLGCLISLSKKSI